MLNAWRECHHCDVHFSKTISLNFVWRSLSGRSQWTKKTIKSIECLTCVIKNLAVLSTILTIRDCTSWLFKYPCMPRLLANLCNPTNLGEFFFLPLSPYLSSCSHFAKINIPIYIHTSSRTYAHYRLCCELLSQTASPLALRNSERNNKTKKHAKNNLALSSRYH